MVSLDVPGAVVLRSNGAFLSGKEQCFGHQNEGAQRPAQFGEVQAFQRRMIAWTNATGNYPTAIAGVEIDCGDAAERRLEQWQTLWADQRDATTPKPIAGWGDALETRIVFFVKRHHAGPGDGWDIEGMSFWIESGTSPTGSTLRARQRHGTTEGGGSEERTEIVFLQDLDCLGAESWREVDEVVFGCALTVEGCGSGGDWLGCGSVLFAGTGLRHSCFYDGPDWFAAGAVEHEDKALFGNLCEGLDAFAVDSNVREGGRGWRVVIPDVVMGGLKVPDAFAGFGIEADDACTEEIVAGAVAAIVVIGRSAEGEVDVAKRFVAAEGCPGAYAPAALP